MVGQLTSICFEDLEKFQIFHTKQNIDFSEFSEEKDRVKSIKYLQYKSILEDWWEIRALPRTSISICAGNLPV